jgi:S1-C subfamily serine protease
VLTIGYLVLEAQSVQLVTHEGRRIPAQVAVYDPVTGLGLLRPLLPLVGVTPAPLGQAASLAKGSPLLVVAGGQPREVGAVRLVDRRDFTGYWEYHLDAALFTSPPLAQHSGAGLFNAQGDLVGIGNLLMLDVLPEDEPGVLPGNLFVPVDVLAPVLAELLRTGVHPQGRRPWMGVNAMAQEGVVRILRVTPGSPAQDAGLRPGHRVVSVDGQPVGTLEEFFKQVWAHESATESIRITVREGAQDRQLLVPVRHRQQTLARPRGI